MQITAIRRMLAAAAAAALASGGGSAMASAAHADQHGQQTAPQVSVVHGIPDEPVDVYVNDEAFLQDLQPMEVTDPAELEAGTYDIAITAAGGDPADPIVTADGIEVPEDGNVSVVAHLSEDGQPTITPFTNDLAQLEQGQARLVVRHTAEAPEVDVRANGDTVASDLTNPNEQTTDVPAGTFETEVVLAGTDEVVLGPQSLELMDGYVTVVYAVGSADQDTLDLLVQTLMAEDQ